MKFSASQPSQNPLMFIPLPLFLLIALYAVRAWVVSGYEQNINKTS